MAGEVETKYLEIIIIEGVSLLTYFQSLVINYKK